MGSGGPERASKIPKLHALNQRELTIIRVKIVLTYKELGRFTGVSRGLSWGAVSKP